MTVAIFFLQVLKSLKYHQSEGLFLAKQLRWSENLRFSNFLTATSFCRRENITGLWVDNFITPGTQSPPKFIVVLD